MLLDRDVEVVGAARSGREAIFYTTTLSPDVVVMDPSNRNMNGIDIVRAIRRLSPSTAVVVFTESAAREDVVAATSAGVSGYVLKDQAKSDLISAVRAVADGGISFAPKVAAMLPGTPGKCTEHLLTRKELQVLELMTVGLSNKGIAEHLGITVGTVKTHVSSVIRKIGVRGRTQAALWMKDHPQLQHPPRRRRTSDRAVPARSSSKLRTPAGGPLKAPSPKL
jgi:DNA-binding NarL/FixJ family response regulator